MREWLDHLIGWLETGSPVVSITCVEVLGSAPCAPGSRMLVNEERTLGTIGGGNLEFRAIEQARKLLASGERCLNQSLPLGPLLSQCCGGRVRLVFESFDVRDIAFWRAVAGLEGTMVSRCEPDAYGKWFFAENKSHTLTGEVAAAAAHHSQPTGFHGQYWREVVCAEKPVVCIFGGGHVGKALVEVLGTLDCEIKVVDPRSEVVIGLAGHTDIYCTDDPDEIENLWKPRTVAVVLTHSHELDYRWVSAILRRNDSAYCGLIGSKTKRARFIRRLRDDGFSDIQISHLTCPIGLPDRNSKHPGAVAISTAAQILPFLADLSQAGTGRSCECTPSGNFSLTREDLT